MTPREIIREIRIKLGYSQQELSKMLNLSQCALSNCETGIRRLSIQKCYKLIKLARLAGIDVEIGSLRPEE